MQNATTVLLRMGLTVGALTAVLVCAELSTQRASSLHSVAMQRSDPIVRVRAISVDRAVVQPDARQRRRTIAVAAPALLALEP